MIDGWIIAFGGMALTALAMLALGLWLGYRWGGADADIDQAIRRQPVSGDAPGSLTVKAKHVAPSTAELFRQLEAEQPPIRELVKSPRHAQSQPRGAMRIGNMTDYPGPFTSQPRALRPAGYRERATDAIAAWTAETDAYIAGLAGR